MCKTTLWKRCVSSICAFAILTVSCIQTSFAANANTSLPSEDGYSYDIEWQNNTDFTIKGYVNGELFDEVSGSVGGETLAVQTFQSTNQNTLSGQEVQEIAVSSIITEVPNGATPNIEDDVSAAAYNTYAGYVQYRVLADQFYYYPLYIYYDIVDTNPASEYELHADKNTTLSVLIGGILAVTGVALGHVILAGIIGYIGGVVSNGTVTKGAHGYFTGTQYDYNVKAENRSVSPNVIKTYSGKAFDGRYRVGSGAWQTGKAYEGYYPQFIRERDTAVATWLFNDFFAGTYDISKWYSAI